MHSSSGMWLIQCKATQVQKKGEKRKKEEETEPGCEQLRKKMAPAGCQASRSWARPLPCRCGSATKSPCTAGRPANSIDSAESGEMSADSFWEVTKPIHTSTLPSSFVFRHGCLQLEPLPALQILRNRPETVSERIVPACQHDAITRILSPSSNQASHNQNLVQTW